jgi:hypothetical protein
MVQTKPEPIEYNDDIDPEHKALLGIEDGEEEEEDEEERRKKRRISLARKGKVVSI